MFIFYGMSQILFCNLYRNREMWYAYCTMGGERHEITDAHLLRALHEYAD